MTSSTNKPDTLSYIMLYVETMPSSDTKTQVVVSRLHKLPRKAVLVSIIQVQRVVWIIHQ